jgi:proline iminopeptidase
MRYPKMFSTLMSIFSASSVAVPATVTHDASLPFIEIDGYKFHVRTFGDASPPPVIAVHGGPGGDLKYLLPIQALAKDFFVIFFDQRGTGLSPRVPKDKLTLENSLEDLHSVVRHCAKGRQVRLLGHSWGAMLVIAYVGLHPELVSHAIAVEPGILTPTSAAAFVERLKASQSIWDALPMLWYIMQTPFVKSQDGHERFDFVRTKMMNRNKPGSPYQCEGQAMPADAFERTGFESFNNMLKPILDDPNKFHWNLTVDVGRYRGGLLMLSSECSFIGHRYQEEFHLPLLPPQTVHVMAKGMGHNMLTLNPEWSLGIVRDFLKDRPNPLFQRTAYGIR